MSIQNYNIISYSFNEFLLYYIINALEHKPNKHYSLTAENHVVRNKNTVKLH